MILPKFWVRSEINWSKKWDTLSSYEVSAINGVVEGLHSSSDWISLKTHQMTSPTILYYCPSFKLDPKSIGQKKMDSLSSYEVCTVNGLVGGLHNSTDWISLKTHQMTPPTIL